MLWHTVLIWCVVVVDSISWILVLNLFMSSSFVTTNTSKLLALGSSFTRSLYWQRSASAPFCQTQIIRRCLVVVSWSAKIFWTWRRMVACSRTVFPKKCSCYYYSSYSIFTWAMSSKVCKVAWTWLEDGLLFSPHHEDCVHLALKASTDLLQQGRLLSKPLFWCLHLNQWCSTDIAGTNGIMQLFYVARDGGGIRWGAGKLQLGLQAADVLYILWTFQFKCWQSFPCIWWLIPLKMMWSGGASVGQSWSLTSDRATKYLNLKVWIVEL